MGTERPAGTREAPETYVLRLEAHDSFGPLLAEWDALATASRNVFATSEWARLWWEHFGGPSRLRIVAARRPGGGLAGIVPLTITRVGPVRIARFVGHGTGDLLGPIHEPSCEITGPQLLRQALGEIESEWDAFFGERLPGDAGWSSASGTSEMSHESSPVLPLARWPTWEAYIGSLSRKLRQDLRHDERTLAERHRTRFRMTQDPSRLSSDLDVVFALHRARWDGSRSSFVPREPFFRRFAALALERGWLRLWILEADDRPVAARYDFEYAGVYNAYNGGRDPAWSKAGVGLVLRAHTMREAMVRGVSEYRFLRGGESYKKRFLTEDPGLVTIARDRTFLGRCVTRAGALLKHNPRLRWLALPLFRNRRG
jgi:CelD/BcsL family acetyltransferase involved in cellulose biosynthesis